MNAVVYDGSAADRAECQRREFYFDDGALVLVTQT